MKHFYILLLLFTTFLSAQEIENDTITITKNPYSFSAGVEYGSILPTNKYLSNHDRINYLGYSFQALKQSSGNKDWEKLYNHPKYGIGFFTYDFLNDKEMKNPFAIYGIYNSTIKQWQKLKWDYNVNFGISFNAKPFNQAENYLNTSVGTKTNMFISAGTGLSYELSNHFDLGLNLKFNHLSNGASKLPNKGLNSLAAQMSLTYYPERIVPKFDTIISDKRKFNSIEFSVFASKKSVYYRGENAHTLPLYDSFKYSVYGAEAFYMRQYSQKSAFGLGLGITMDEQYNNTMYVSDSTLYQKKRFATDRPLFSIIPTYRLIMGKMYINIGAGVYPFKESKKYDVPRFFQRIALQYQFTDRFFASFGINAYDLHIANYLEWKIGYVFYKKQRQ